MAHFCRGSGCKCDIGVRFKHGMAKLKKGSLMEYAISEKEKHPSKIILLRVGEFFETYGIDALMLVEFAGLNAMAGHPLLTTLSPC
eukprot:1341351-Amorphochlora_amoeboformis.AAC.1